MCRRRCAKFRRPRRLISSPAPNTVPPHHNGHGRLRERRRGRWARRHWPPGRSGSGRCTMTRRRRGGTEGEGEADKEAGTERTSRKSTRMPEKNSGSVQKARNPKNKLQRRQLPRPLRHPSHPQTPNAKVCSITRIESNPFFFHTYLSSYPPPLFLFLLSHPFSFFFFPSSSSSFSSPLPFLFLSFYSSSLATSISHQS